MAAMVALTGLAMPVTPHLLGHKPNAWAEALSSAMNVKDIPPAFWIEGTLEVMRRCDGVLLMASTVPSAGVKGEIAEAARLEIPLRELTLVADKAPWAERYAEVQAKVRQLLADIEGKLNGGNHAKQS